MSQEIKKIEGKFVDRRRDSIVKNIMIPVVIATITGISASYMATQVTLAVVETRVKYLESDVVSIKEILQSVNANQIELAKRGEWMSNTEKRMSNIEKTQESLVEQIKDKYTRKEAEKDNRHLIEKIESLGFKMR